MRLSIVTTLYSSAPYLQEFYARISSAAAAITSDFEIILVNDGSPDNALEMAVSLHERDHRVRVIDLSKNFGHHKPMMTGLAYARGDLVFLLDSDLEEEPELLTTFHHVMHSGPADVDVVYGVQNRRRGGLVERVTGTIYFKLFNLLSTDPVPENLITARLMTRRYVAALVQHREREVCVSGLWASTGFTQLPVAVTKRQRKGSAYTFRGRASHLVNGITSFSNKPLVLIFYLGCLIVGVASMAALYLIFRRLLFGVLLSGWPSVIVSIWLLGGLTIFCVGVIGIYLSKVFLETKQRPYTIIRQVYERREPSPSLEPEAVASRLYDDTGRGTDR